MTLPNGIGGIALGAERGDVRTFGLPTLTGVGLHMVLSAIYGVVIVYIAMMYTHEYAVTGIVFGLAVWIFNYYGVGAFHAGSKKLAAINPIPVGFLLHAIFGAIAGMGAQMLAG